MNRKQQTIAGILALGYTETHRSKKYRTFERVGHVLMVGKAGGLRKTSGSLQQSVSLTDTFAHKAYAYIGRASAQQPTIDGLKWREIFSTILQDKAIPNE